MGGDLSAYFFAIYIGYVQIFLITLRVGLVYTSERVNQTEISISDAMPLRLSVKV